MNLTRLTKKGCWRESTRGGGKRENASDNVRPYRTCCDVGGAVVGFVRGMDYDGACHAPSYVQPGVGWLSSTECEVPRVK